MGNEGAEKSSERIRRAIMTFATVGGFGERASNHTAHVVEQLGRAIVSGEYPARTMIPLDPDISEMFDVSRTVVREAKKTLIAKGLIQSKAKVGTHVREPREWNMFDPDVLRWHAALRNPTAFLNELLEIRLIFEPAAAAQTAKLATQADCLALAHLCDDMEAADSRAAFAAADLEFHKLVLKLSGNRFLQSLGDIVQTALYSLFVAQVEDRSSEELVDVAQRHRAIVDAISKGDVQEAQSKMHAAILEGHI